MSFLPSVECGKFKSKQAFQSGKILACNSKSEICATFTPKLINPLVPELIFFSKFWSKLDILVIWKAKP